MPRRRWDDPWQKYPESRPLPVEGGLRLTATRGPIAGTWWSKRFVDVLESYGLGTRMQRGRRYARSGQVMSLDVSPGLIAAQVQGSRRTPYLVTVRSVEPSPIQWRKLDDAFASRVSFAARLLAGEVPPELEEVFADAGVALFPRTWGDVRANCNCPDWENPCKHIAAVLYVFAERLDGDPWSLLEWRGRTRDDLLGPLRASATPGSEQSVAPWWPLVPTGTGISTTVPPDARSSRSRAVVDDDVDGGLDVDVDGGLDVDASHDDMGLAVSIPASGGRAGSGDDAVSEVLQVLDVLEVLRELPEPPDPWHQVLLRMDPLEAEVAGAPLTQLLAGVYDVIVHARSVEGRDLDGHDLDGHDLDGGDDVSGDDGSGDGRGA